MVSVSVAVPNSSRAASTFSKSMINDVLRLSTGRNDSGYIRRALSICRPRARLRSVDALVGDLSPAQA